MHGCSFTENEAKLDGGAINFNIEVSLSDFEYPRNLDMQSNVFKRNKVTGEGGAVAIELFTGTNVTLVGNRYEENVAGYGGAVFISQTCFPLMVSEEYIGNVATFEGGAVYLDSVDNLLSCSNTNRAIDSAK